MSITFVMIMIWLVNVRVMEPLDAKITPMLEDPANEEQVIQNVRNFTNVWPIIIIVGIWLWAILSTLKKDPNRYMTG